MQRIFQLLLISMCAINPLLATEDKQDLRILELLPNLYCPLPVDPSVPADFVALSPTGDLDPYDWIYWGPRDVLEAFFVDQDSLDSSILRVKLSPNVAQTGKNSFNHESPEMLFANLRKVSPTDFTSAEVYWGDYPVLAVSARILGKLFFTAWVGLNDSNGWTLMFNLVYPSKDGHPNQSDRQLWENLLTKTALLKDGDYFKAAGQDLQEGYTIVNVGGAKLKMIAEKRQRDELIQVVVIPEKPGVSFHYADMQTGLMGAKWRYKEPVVKVFGKIVVKEGNGTTTIDHATSIFYKTVQEFSYKKENGKNHLVFLKKTR